MGCWDERWEGIVPAEGEEAREVVAAPGSKARLDRA